MSEDIRRLALAILSMDWRADVYGRHEKIQMCQCTHCINRIAEQLSGPLGTARAEGYRAGVEAAAKVADEHKERQSRRAKEVSFPETSGYFGGRSDEAHAIAHEIRALGVNADLRTPKEKP